MIKFAEDNGIKIGIKTARCILPKMNGRGKNLAINPAIWSRIFDAVPSKNFGLNYDPSHMIWQQMDLIQPIYDFKERIHHVHLKDAKLSKKKKK